MCETMGTRCMGGLEELGFMNRLELLKEKRLKQLRKTRYEP